MGTHGLIEFNVRGFPVAFYNHYDSHPNGLGSEIFKFLRSLTPEDLDRMATNIQNLEVVDPQCEPSKELQDRYVALGFNQTQDLARTPASDTWEDLLHGLREGKILPAILDNTLVHLPDFSDNHAEWTYRLDFAHRTVTTHHEDGRVDDTVEFTETGGDYAQKLTSVVYHGASRQILHRRKIHQNRLATGRVGKLVHPKAKVTFDQHWQVRVKSHLQLLPRPTCKGQIVSRGGKQSRLMKRR